MRSDLLLQFVALLVTGFALTAAEPGVLVGVVGAALWALGLSRHASAVLRAASSRGPATARRHRHRREADARAPRPPPPSPGGGRPRPAPARPGRPGSHPCTSTVGTPPGGVVPTLHRRALACPENPTPSRVREVEVCRARLPVLPRVRRDVVLAPGVRPGPGPEQRCGVGPGRGVPG